MTLLSIGLAVAVFGPVLFGVPAFVVGAVMVLVAIFTGHDE